MRRTKIRGYSLQELASWPQPNYETMSWLMYSLKLDEENTLQWYRRYIEKDDKTGLFVDFYDDYSSATEQAAKLNKETTKNIEQLILSKPEKDSLILKIEKALTAKTRLMNEEQLMLEVAIKKHANDIRIDHDELVIEPEIEKVRTHLHSILSEMPYLEIIYLYRYGSLLYLNKDNVWVRGSLPRKKAGKIYYQERIARGFGLSGLAHWGKTKAAIRAILLPRANQLLQLSSVKRMLLDAQLKGQNVLIVDGFVFWFEEKNNIGWVVKIANDSAANTKGNTLWKEGTIISKNHGRIVVLPYIKENGDYVQGHTKNAPNDGKALPRHSDEYVELPFEILKGDFMRGLFGELIYE